jgi:hypothetical protein
LNAEIWSCCIASITQWTTDVILYSKMHHLTTVKRLLQATAPLVATVPLVFTLLLLATVVLVLPILKRLAVLAVLEPLAALAV